FHGRISRHVRGQRPCRDLVPRRMARAAAMARLYFVLLLVLREIVSLAFGFHLGPRHVAPDTRRSNDEFRVEVHVADGVHLPDLGGGLALHRPPFVGMALVFPSPPACLCCALVVPRLPQEIRSTHISFRRMSTVVFAIITIF